MSQESTGKSVQTSIMLSATQNEFIEQVAEIEGVSKAAVIRRAIDVGLPQLAEGYNKIFVAKKFIIQILDKSDVVD